jgi:hypothetical protein
MIKLRSQSTKSRVFHVFRIGTATLGCLFLLFSFIFPFYSSIPSIQAMYLHQEYYDFWSFKADYHFPVYAVTISQTRSMQWWYSDYWFKFDGIRLLGFPWVMISMFVFQILALASGIASILFDRRLLSPGPVLLCLAVLMEMIYFDIDLDRTWYFSKSNYQLGYWLIYPSLVFFTIAFALSLLSHKKKTDLQAS